MAAFVGFWRQRSEQPLIGQKLKLGQHAEVNEACNVKFSVTEVLEFPSLSAMHYICTTYDTCSFSAPFAAKDRLIPSYRSEHRLSKLCVV